MQHEGGMKEHEHEAEIKVGAEQQNRRRLWFWRQSADGTYQPIPDSLPEDTARNQASPQRNNVDDEEGLALYLPTLPEAKTGTEARGEFPSSAELPGSSQQVSQVPEGCGGEAVTSATVAPLAADEHTDELKWPMARKPRVAIARRKSNELEDGIGKFTSFRPTPAPRVTIAPTGVVPELALVTQSRHEQSRENINW